VSGTKKFNFGALPSLAFVGVFKSLNEPSNKKFLFYASTFSGVRINKEGLLLLGMEPSTPSSLWLASAKVFSPLRTF